MDPLSKIRDFEQVIRKNAANPVDVAFMKLCYVDIDPNTDAGPIFTAYRDTMARLRQEFPRTQFVHMTVPLVARPNDPKSLSKKLLGRTVAGYGDNLAREKLNKLMRKEYADKGPLFDFAFFESTRMDGRRVAGQLEGETYYALEKEYTDDGGHLNAQGRRLVAEQLLVFLAETLY